LRSAIENVVRNGVRYTREGTTVEITLRCTAEKTAGSDKMARHSVITVRDHGPGVPPEALQHLFRPFYRVADARDRQSGGVGLGLSITARLCAFTMAKSTPATYPKAACWSRFACPSQRPANNP
jgi:two-component system sensor histidine kinase CpxA